MNALPANPISRLRITLHGAVQGVGFRPFVFRLATGMGLTGWIINNAQGVFIEVEGASTELHTFLKRLNEEKPPRSRIHGLEASWLDPIGFVKFEIRESNSAGPKTVLALPDIGTCDDCLREIHDPTNRRFRYPFTNCVNCGPRFTILKSLPYDRQNTSMSRFVMCSDCQAEYDDPGNRRFHAQPNACPVCGPQLALWDGDGNILQTRHEALAAAIEALKQGRILAIKGIGGFHLMAHAGDEQAVRLLRQRKHREEKPFALLFPDLDAVRLACKTSAMEERLLLSPEAPIVLLQRRNDTFSACAPGNPNLGVMLPSNPIHHLLMSEIRMPLVATSGNLTDEPICIDELEALKRLHGIADLFLVHDRPIIRHVDDSIVRVVLDREMVLRRARGYAPLPVGISRKSGSRTILAVGAHLKNSVALAMGSNVFISQHIGDLESPEAMHAFERVSADLQHLYETKADCAAADAHPDYLSTQWARRSGLPIATVQHHYAHVLSCMAENDLEAPVLGVAWDGTGYGLDGTIWGGEFLKITADGFERFAHLRTFTLPGGDKASREPRRSALGLLAEWLGDAALERREIASLAAFEPGELKLLWQSLRRKINSPRTSSAGRLFDAVSSLINLRHISHFEGQSAMEMEFAASHFDTAEAYPLPVVGQGPLQLDWAPMMEILLQDAGNKVAAGLISARFHNALVEGIIGVARKAGLEKVALSGGCFQNRYLAELAVRRLQLAGFRPYWHQRVPPNDGGIALGQALAAARSTLIDTITCA